MQNIFSALDHVVLGVPELKAGMDYIERLTGCKPVDGGKHDQFGTQNALLKIGKLCYLEILAPDPSNPKEEKLWMGLSDLTHPTITRFAVRSSNLEKDSNILKSYNSNHGNCLAGRREKADGSLLEWQLSLPLALPKVSCIPFLIDWGVTQHPSDSLALGCNLTKMALFSPDSISQNAIFAQLNLESLIQPGLKRIELTLECPKGTIKLS